MDQGLKGSEQRRVRAVIGWLNLSTCWIADIECESIVARNATIQDGRVADNSSFLEFGLSFARLRNVI